MTSAQKTSDRIPSAASRRELDADGLDDRLQRVERARPKIAVHYAERGKRGSGRGSVNDTQRDRAFRGSGDRHPFLSLQLDEGSRVDLFSWVLSESIFLTTHPVHSNVHLTSLVNRALLSHF